MPTETSPNRQNLEGAVSTTTGADNAPRTPQIGAGFKPATGPDYLSFFKDMHDRILLDWYMEIGCRLGLSFASVRSKTVAVDPFFRVKIDIIHTKPALHVFQTTSDDFFTHDFLGRNEITLSMCFIDGMHLFEFALRDFINTERHMHRDGVVILHDCCPSSYEMTTRDLDNLPRAWTGDVWKLIPVLQKYRPDLKLTILDCAPTGLLLVSDLDPANDTLSQNYDTILRDYQLLSLESLGAAAFYGSFEYTEALGYLDRSDSLFDRIALDPSLALRLHKHST